MFTAAAGACEVRVAGEVTAVVHHELERVAVAADVGPAPVVQAHPVLAAAAGQLERLAARVEEEAVAADRDRLAPRPVGAADVAAVEAGRDVEAIVEAPAERVQHPLAGQVLAEAGEDDPAHVGLAVAVGVLEVEQVGRRTRRRRRRPSRRRRVAIGTSAAKSVLLS